MVTVILFGWMPGLNHIEVIKFIREQGALSLPDAKDKFDLLLDGQRVEIQFESELEAQQFADRAKRLGVLHAEISSR